MRDIEKQELRSARRLAQNFRKQSVTGVEIASRNRNEDAEIGYATHCLTRVDENMSKRAAQAWEISHPKQDSYYFE